jgi:hypothetical protein
MRKPFIRLCSQKLLRELLVIAAAADVEPGGLSLGGLPQPNPADLVQAGTPHLKG